MHPLDRPVWASLTSFHASVSTDNAWARRFNPEVNVFASARDDSPQALAALAELVVPGERIFVLQVPQIAVPDGLVALKQAQGVQMVATRALRDAPALPVDAKPTFSADILNRPCGELRDTESAHEPESRAGQVDADVNDASSCSRLHWRSLFGFRLMTRQYKLGASTGSNRRSQPRLLQRGIHLLPLQGDRPSWLHTQGRCWSATGTLRRTELDEGSLAYR